MEENSRIFFARAAGSGNDLLSFLPPTSVLPVHLPSQICFWSEKERKAETILSL